MAEPYWQYASHYCRLIRTMGGLTQRNNQGWGDGGEEGQQGNPQQQGQQPNPQQQANGNGYVQGGENRQGGEQRPGGEQRQGGRQEETEPGLGGVAFLQNGRGTPADQDPAGEDQ